MSDSLREQMLKAGFKDVAGPKKKPKPNAAAAAGAPADAEGEADEGEGDDDTEMSADDAETGANDVAGETPAVIVYYLSTIRILFTRYLFFTHQYNVALCMLFHYYLRFIYYYMMALCMLFTCYLSTIYCYYLFGYCF